MQYDVETPAQYLQSLDDDWRRDKLDQIRSIIRSHGPELVEGIDYKMLSYRDDDDIVFGLNAQKHYVSFYVGDIQKIDPDGTLLNGLNVGKGCVRFTKTKPVSENVRKFIERAIDMSRRGEDIDC